MARASDLSVETQLSALGQMFLIRRFEERCVELSNAKEFPGTTPVCVGQEAIAVAVMLTLRVGDLFFTTHRNHGHVLARGGLVNRVMAELYGKANGYCRGKAGTFHVADAELGIPSASAIVGAGLPQAVGAALAFARLGQARVAVASLGDRTLNEGSSWEAFNLAALWQLPVIFLCEHNDAVPYDARKSAEATDRLSNLVKPYDLEVDEVDGTDLLETYRVLRNAVERARQERRPWFIEARTMHWPGHAGPVNFGLETGYTRLAEVCERAPDDIYAEWRAHDPVLKTARMLLDQGHVDRQTLDSIQQSVERQVEAAVDFARRSPFPEPAEAFEDLYA